VADDSIDSEVLSDGSASYFHGADGLISESRSGTSKFCHADALGSVRALTNGSGSVTDSRSTDAFGLVVTSSGSTPTPFGFAGNHGYQQDDETGLMRLGHRMYDASTGRFISRDPIRDGYNWYAYCGNDPINIVDPEGLSGDGFDLTEIVFGPTPKVPLPVLIPKPLPFILPITVAIGVITVIGGILSPIHDAVTHEVGHPKGPFGRIGQDLADALFPMPTGTPDAQGLTPAPRYNFPTRKEAYEAAKRDSVPGYEPVLDPPNGNLPPHYHPGGPPGGRNPGRHPKRAHDHYNFPKKQF
jgi:RHS repeat-associated protein